MTRAEQIKKEMAAKAAKMRESGDTQKWVAGKPMSKDPKGLYAGKKKKPKKPRFNESGERVRNQKTTANKTAAEKAREASRKRRLGEK